MGRERIFFYNHKKCEFFPCHETTDPQNFNCLFCYCPLYALGSKCGGNFKYTEQGIKDCSACKLPHKRKNYGYIMSKYQEINGVGEEKPIVCTREIQAAKSSHT